MRSTEIASKIFFGALFLVLSYWWRNARVGRPVIAYLGAISLMVYVFGALGVLTYGRVPGKGYEPVMIGLFGGALVGLAAGILLGRMAVGHTWVYWTVVGIEACVMILLPRLT